MTISEVSKQYLGVTISTRPESWGIRGIPLYCRVGPRRIFPHSQNRPRVDFLAEERNRAMEEALSRYPKATHIVNVESQYLLQTHAIESLIDRYEEIGGNVILGASTWAKMQDMMWTVHQFYDSWATPEFYMYRCHRLPSGLVQVSSVGSCLIFPSQVWKEHRFHTPEPFPDAGIYYNWLCRKSSLPILLDLDSRLFRDYHDSDLVPYRTPLKRMKKTALWMIKERSIRSTLSSFFGSRGRTKE